MLEREEAPTAETVFSTKTTLSKTSSVAEEAVIRILEEQLLECLGGRRESDGAGTETREIIKRVCCTVAQNWQSRLFWRSRAHALDAMRKEGRFMPLGEDPCGCLGKPRVL